MDTGAYIQVHCFNYSTPSESSNQIVSSCWFNLAGDIPGNSLILLGTKSGEICVYKFSRNVFAVDLLCRKLIFTTWVSNIKFLEYIDDVGYLICATSSNGDVSAQIITISDPTAVDFSTVGLDIEETSFHPIIQVEYHEETLFLVRSNSIVLHAIQNSQTNGVSFTKVQDIYVPYSSFISNISFPCPSKFVCFTKEGLCIVYARNSADIWEVSEHLSKEIETQISVHYSSQTTHEMCAEDEEMQEEIIQEYSTPEEKDKGCLLENKYLPKFCGSSFSIKGKFLAIGFEKIAKHAANYKPDKFRSSTFTILETAQFFNRNLENTIRDKTPSALLFDLFDDHNCIPVKDNSAREKQLLKNLSNILKTRNDSQIFQRAVDIALHNQNYQYLLENMDETQPKTGFVESRKCPCGANFSNQKSSVLRVLCTNAHEFRRCSETFAPCVTAANVYQCCLCEFPRIESGQPVVGMKGNTLGGPDIKPCQICGDIMSL
jgi:hypothetical protein